MTRYASNTLAGIPDSVIMDSSGVSQRIFAFSGNDGTAGASATLAQLKFDLTGLVRVHIGLGGVGNTTTNVDIHTGIFDNNYFGASPTTGHLFSCGTGPSDTSAYFYWIGFTPYPTMNSATTGSIARGTSAGTPLTEIFNPNVNLNNVSNPVIHDIVISGVVGAGADGVLRSDDITSGTITRNFEWSQLSGGLAASSSIT